MRVGLFITCLTDTFHPRVGAAVTVVLRHFGCDVRFPMAQTCCGQPAFNNGLHEEAAKLLLRLAHAFEDVPHVVCPSASCAAMISHLGPDLFAPASPERRIIDDLASKTHIFSSFLCDVLGADLDDLSSAGKSVDQQAAYHFPCHQRSFDSPDSAFKRARDMLGCELKPLERMDQCCGFGGMFAMEFPTISGAMTQDKVNCVRDCGASVLVCDESGCRLSIEGALHRNESPVRVTHSAELLAEALGLTVPEIE